MYLPNEDNRCAPPSYMARKRKHPCDKEQSSSSSREHAKIPSQAFSRRPSFEKHSSPSSEKSTPSEHVDYGGHFSDGELELDNLSVRGVFLDSQFFGPSHWMTSMIHVRTSSSILPPPSTNRTSDIVPQGPRFASRIQGWPWKHSLQTVQRHD